MQANKEVECKVEWNLLDQVGLVYLCLGPSLLCLITVRFWVTPKSRNISNFRWCLFPWGERNRHISTAEHTGMPCLQKVWEPWDLHRKQQLSCHREKPQLACVGCIDLCGPLCNKKLDILICTSLLPVDPIQTSNPLTEYSWACMLLPDLLESSPPLKQQLKEAA